MRKEFNLPDPGEGLTDAEIVTWLVAPGDVVEVNQVVVEIETFKSLVELPSPWDGVVLEVLAKVGESVAVGSPILAVEVAGVSGAEEAAGYGGDGGVAAAEPADRSPAPEPDDRNPVLVGYGTSADEDSAGDLAESVGSVGDGIPAGTAFPAPELGERNPVLVGYGTGAGEATTRRLRRSVAPREDAQSGDAPAGSTRPAASLSGGVAAVATTDSSRSGANAPSASGAPRQQTTPAGRSLHMSSASGGVLAKPPVRKLARDLGVDLTAVRGTGPGGIITRDDVVAFTETAAQPRIWHPGDDEPWLVGGAVSSDGRQTRVPVKSV